ncbi:MAG TPA: helix-turn-helix domain-containing protein [Ohtaekwangia sp.]|nr:helix-turn-helix domain-containing protein [Ohtaekwangia sp.]
MVANIVTIEDLQEFRRELIEEIRGLLSQRKATSERKWLKSHEVRRMLFISPGTLQNLRVNGSLPFTKIGGVIYYNADDIEQMLQDHKHDKHFLKKKCTAKSFDDPVDPPKPASGKRDRQRKAFNES